MTATTVITFTRQMADLLGGGLPLSRCIDVVRRQHQDAFHEETLSAVMKDLRSGQSLSEALAHHEQLFSPLYLGLVRAGESSGALENAFTRLADHLSREAELKRKARNALVYPALVLSLAVVVCLFLTTFVIPRFQFLFDDLGQRLPWPTRLLIDGSALLRQFGLVAIPVVALAFISFRKSSLPFAPRALASAARGRWIRPLILHSFVARWSGTLSALLAAGFTLSEGLQLTRQSLRAHPFAPELEIIEERVAQGGEFSAALRDMALFPPVVRELISAGEESGRLEETLIRIAATFERENDDIVRTTMNVLEPALIVVTALAVGFVALAMLLPIFEMSGAAR